MHRFWKKRTQQVPDRTLTLRNLLLKQEKAMLEGACPAFIEAISSEIDRFTNTKWSF